MKPRVAARLGRCAGLLTVLVSAGGPAAGQGMPVIDLANVTQTLEAVSQLKAQLERQLELLRSVQGTRGMGALGAASLGWQYLPTDWVSQYASLQLGAHGQPGAAALRLRNTTPYLGCAASGVAANALCNADVAQIAQTVTDQEAAVAVIQARASSIGQLQGAVDSTADLKAAADLSARIGVELASLQTEQSRLYAYSLFIDAQRRLLDRQRREVATERLLTHGSASQGLAPLSFP